MEQEENESDNMDESFTERMPTILSLWLKKNEINFLKGL